MTVTVRGVALANATSDLTDIWPKVESATVEGRHIQGVFDMMGGLETEAVPLASAASSALAFAIIDTRGRLRTADAAFAALGVVDFGGHAMERLASRARRDGRVVGLVETTAGASVAVCAALPDQTLAWPVAEALCREIASLADPIVLMALAPTRASALALQAMVVFGLSELEARLAAALLEAPTLEIAAGRVGVGRETARGALAGAMRKMGVRRTPLLVRRLADLIHQGTISADGDPLAEIFDLTAGEAKVTRLSAEGATTADVAAALGVKPETVKSHLRSTFSKSGVARVKDLSRLDVELRTLTALSRAREVVAHANNGDGVLRMIVRPDGRRVAFMDYGPAGGRLLLVCHALASGRTLPPGLAMKLKAAGYRPVVPQRPGFGLTDPAQGAYLAASAEDMAAILDALKRDSADVFARDIATATLLTFAERFPDRLGRAVLLNPESFVGPKRSAAYAIPAAARILQRRPELTATFFEVLRRQIRTDRLAALLRGAFQHGAPSDSEGLRDPERVEWMVNDIQAMVARSISGMVQERLVYAAQWRPPARVGGQSWVIARCAELGAFEAEDWWQTLPGFRLEIVEAGGLLTPLTHPDTVVRLLGRADSQATRSASSRAWPRKS